MGSQGIMMFNRGDKMVVRAIVALNSIRKHCDKPITFYLEKPYPDEFKTSLLTFENVTIIDIEEKPEYDNFVRKNSLFATPPYDYTLWLDSDVLVLDNIDEMFNYLDFENVDLCIPHFAQRTSDKGLVNKRIKSFAGLIENKYMNEAVKGYPGINTGIFSFKNSVRWENFAKIWTSIAYKGAVRKIFIPDEIVLQILYPSLSDFGLKCEIVPSEYNVSITHDQNFSNPKIMHYHGDKHVIDVPECNFWKEEFKTMLDNNVANIKSLLPYADKRLKNFMEGKPVETKKDKKDKKVEQKPMEVEYHEIETNFHDRSTKEDTNDDSGWRHTRSRHIGSVIETEFHQYSPKFFTRDRATLSIEGSYRGSSAFLICNGPSFAGLNHDLLRKPGVMTFGINNGPKTFRPNFWTCVDDPVRFLKSIWLDPKIQKFVPFHHFEKNIFNNETWKMTNIKVGDCPNVIGYNRNEQFNAARFLKENTINWGNHRDFGGSRSVMLPAIRILHLLGFRKIYLLGCDMKMSEKYTYHFDEKREKGAVNCNNTTYNRLKDEYLKDLKPFLEEDDTQIFNCYEDSELKVFPYVSFTDAIKEATEKLGDVENERVWGMYANPKDRNKFVAEPPKEQKEHLKTIESIKQNHTVSNEVFDKGKKQTTNSVEKNDAQHTTSNVINKLNQQNNTQQ